MAKFFIDRPIFAWVIAIILMLAGVASVTTATEARESETEVASKDLPIG